jgi:cyclopropane fatty-acyl-phospholipid synthase-like methyltransferase
VKVLEKVADMIVSVGVFEHVGGLTPEGSSAPACW